MTPAQGVDDVTPGIVNPGRPPVPLTDSSVGGHPLKKMFPLKIDFFKNLRGLTSFFASFLHMPPKKGSIKKGSF